MSAYTSRSFRAKSLPKNARSKRIGNGEFENSNGVKTKVRVFELLHGGYFATVRKVRENIEALRVCQSEDFEEIKRWLSGAGWGEEEAQRKAILTAVAYLKEQKELDDDLDALIGKDYAVLDEEDEVDDVEYRPDRRARRRRARRMERLGSIKNELLEKPEIVETEGKNVDQKDES